jgi:hypothetical protein
MQAPPDPADIRAALATLRWTHTIVGELTVRDGRTGRRWADGRLPMPPAIWQWIAAQAAAMADLPSFDGWQKETEYVPSGGLAEALRHNRMNEANFARWIGCTYAEVLTMTAPRGYAPKTIAALGDALNRLYLAHPVPPPSMWSPFIREVATREIAEKLARRQRGDG